MTKSLKDKVSLIEKVAQELAMPAPLSRRGPPLGRVKTNPQVPSAASLPVLPGSTPKAHGPSTGYVYQGNPAIREMQKAIQNFANVAVKYNTTTKEVNGKMVNVVNNDDKRRDFNDFLTEQFSASADIHGDEFSPNAKDTSKDSKLPTDLIQMSNVISGLQRIVSGSKEFMLDGVWGIRTNNAIRNIYALAAALVSANEALGGTAPNDSRVFKRSDLSKLKEAIPEEKDPVKEKVSQQELANKAKILTPLIDKLSEFYQYYSDSIMRHPAYISYITDNTPLLTVNPGQDPAQLNENEQSRLQEANKIVLPQIIVPNSKNQRVNLNNNLLLSYLTSIKNLQELMKQHLGYAQSEVNNDRAMRRIVKSILEQVSTFISNYKPMPVAPKPKPLPDQVSRSTNMGYA